MEIYTYQNRGNNLRTKIKGIFDPDEVRQKARAFAELTESKILAGENKGDPQVIIKACGWWEDENGHTIILNRPHKVKKIGYKYYYIEDVDGETVKATPSRGDLGYDPCLFIGKADVSVDTTEI